MRSSRVKMRSRPIVNASPLPIVPTDDKDAAELDTHPDDPHHHSSHSHSHSHQPHTAAATAISIPIPPIDYDNHYYSRFPYPPFAPPINYIKFHQATPASLYSAYDHYDLLYEDVEWLTNHNNNTNNTSTADHKLTQDSMENLIDLFEKDAGVITLRGELMTSDEKIDVSKFYTLARAITSAATNLHFRHGKNVESVYNYWINKRKQWGKSLLRIFQEPPPKGNTDPHVAFRPRTEGRRISKRNPRKDDFSAYNKMRVLGRDFIKVSEIIDTLIAKEVDKREHHLLTSQIFDERMINTYQIQKIATSSSSVAALSTTLLPNPLTTITGMRGDVTALSLLRTTLPASTWVKAEKKKLKKSSSKNSLPQHATQLTSSASASSVTTTSHSSSSSHSSKSSHRSSKLKDASSHRSKKDSLPPLSSAAPSLSSSALLSSSAVSNVNAASVHGRSSEVYDYYSSEDELLSEDEDDRAYFQSIEQYVKRVCLHDRSSPPHSHTITLSPPPSHTHAAASAAYPFQYSSELAWPDDELLPPAELITPPPGVSAVLGRCRARTGRAGLLWLDPVLYVHAQAAGMGALKMEPMVSLSPPPSAVQHMGDHTSATSFSPYPSSTPSPSSHGGGGMVGSVGSVSQPVSAASMDGWQPTPVNIQQLQHGAASMVVDVPVPVAAVTQ